MLLKGVNRYDGASGFVAKEVCSCHWVVCKRIKCLVYNMKRRAVNQPALQYGPYPFRYNSFGGYKCLGIPSTITGETSP